MFPLNCFLIVSADAIRKPADTIRLSADNLIVFLGVFKWHEIKSLTFVCGVLWNRKRMIPWLFFATINHSFSFYALSSLLSMER